MTLTAGEWVWLPREEQKEREGGIKNEPANKKSRLNL